MAKLILDYYNEQDIYNDGDIEEELLRYYSGCEDIDIDDSKYFYFTTDIRNNILNWFPFTKKDEVLEIGTGCGTLTGLLCDRTKEVVGVEGSKRRAMITYHRHKDKKNLSVYAGNIENISLDTKFDYIILIGVFEYAKQFFDCDNPFDYFLDIMKSFLKPTGKVLIAIENRYGIKYWAGCNEDHLNRPYIGLEGYENSNISTFGYHEFIQLIARHGYTKYKFYYPFPDYKLPNIIYTNERLPKKEEVRDIPIYPYHSNVDFHIQSVLKGLLDNQLFPIFSNSFLIEFGRERVKLSDIIYAKNLDYRNNNYKITTVENSQHEFMKIANDNSVKHLNTIFNNHQMLKSSQIPCCEVSLDSFKLHVERIDGIGVADYILQLAVDKKMESIEKEIESLFHFYKKISEKRKFDNPIVDDLYDIYKSDTYILKYSLIDANVANLIRNKDGEYILIDQEWLDDRQLPLDYLLYFSFNYIFRNQELFDVKWMNKIFKKYGITKKKISVFQKIEKYYFTEKNDVVDVKTKDLLESFKLDAAVLESALYFDKGYGFCEDNKQLGRLYKIGNDRYKVEFYLQEVPIQRVRFYPSLREYHFVEIADVMVNGQQIEYEQYGIYNMNHKSILLDKNPYIEFPCNHDCISIEFVIKEIDECLRNSVFDSLFYKEMIPSAVLYFDTGKDFNESEKKIVNYYFDTDGNYLLNVELPPFTKKIRFDPSVYGRKFYIFDDFKVNNAQIEYEALDIIEVSGCHTLLGKNPRLIFENNFKTLSITLRMRKMLDSEVQCFMNEVEK